MFSSASGVRCRNRERKDKRNQKGILKKVLVGEDQKSCEDSLRMNTSTVGHIDVGTHFKTAFCPSNEKAEPPIFRRIQEFIPKSSCSIGRIHNCLNLSNNKTMWLPSTLPVIILKKTSVNNQQF